MFSLSTFFGALDVLSFISHLLTITITINLGLSGLTPLGIFHALAENLLIISLLGSAYFMVRNKRIGWGIYLFQLPFRLYFGILTFGFLNDYILRGIPHHLTAWLLVLLFLLEGVRVFYAIQALRTEKELLN